MSPTQNPESFDDIFGHTPEPLEPFDVPEQSEAPEPLELDTQETASAPEPWDVQPPEQSVAPEPWQIESPEPVVAPEPLEDDAPNTVTAPEPIEWLDRAHETDPPPEPEQRETVETFDRDRLQVRAGKRMIETHWEGE